MEWIYFSKEFIEFSTGFDRDSLHLVVGVCLQFMTAAAFKVPVSRSGPWLVALAFALANELNDLMVEYWDLPARQFGEAAKDIVLTMFVPTLVLLTARHMPQLFRDPGRTHIPPSDANSSNCPSCHKDP